MALILDFFVSNYLPKLASFVEGEICKTLQVEEELKKFQRRLERIGRYLERAERKRCTDSDIGQWVKELKDIMYDADDIIDLCIIEGGRLLEGRPLTSAVRFPYASPCSYFKCMKLRHELSAKIEGLNNRLKEIDEDSSLIRRLEDTDQGPQDHRENSHQTSPLEIKADIVGTQVEDDAQNLIKSILKNDKQKYHVFGIVGMGGIGKTTLARKIYNDEWIIENFPLRIWLYVSKHYSENELLKEIIRSAGGKVDGAESRRGLQSKAVSLLSRNFFIVLDDVWSVDVWENLLRESIISGVGRSKILVTTRDEGVTRTMRASVHHVEKMDEGSGWDLLRKMVFEDGCEDDISRLKGIGIKIIKKCDGLPLAIKAIAGVLGKMQRSKQAWEAVLESDSWRMNQNDEETPRALHLSYEDLPSHLKQCFLHSSLYINRSISRNDLTRLWVAEGFVRTNGERLMEDVAEDYYWELISRNLLQADPRYMDAPRCTMHDLLRSLAHSLIEGEGASISYGQTFNTSSTLTKIRWLSIMNMGEGAGLPEVILEQKCLRTLILTDSPKTRMIDSELLQRLKHLRVLNLCETSIECLPDCIGKLIHLRYLDLDRTKIHKIPESIGRLACLQTLNITECEHLHRLPKTITMLQSLRCLRLKHTPLTHLPKGIRKLKNLNNLGGFIVGRDERGSRPGEGCDLEELQPLSKLRHLRIYNLERAVKGASVLADMTSLKRLLLSWDNQAPLGEEQLLRAEDTCNMLSPPPTVVNFDINHFPYQLFPSWMLSTASFPDLAYLKLRHLPSCAKLSPLGQLPELKLLSIRQADAVVTIGPEFLGRPSPGAAAFPKLEVMQFREMPNWEQWSSCIVEGLKLLPNLEKFYLIECPKLRALPEVLRHAIKLKSLHIQSTHSLTEIMNLAVLEELHVKSNQSLRRISNLPSLRHLVINDCPGLENVEDVDMLQHLILEYLPSTEHLPAWLSRLMEQYRGEGFGFKKFELQCSSPLLESCLRDGANWHIVQQIPEVRIRTADGSRFIWYTNDPHMYDSNVGS